MAMTDEEACVELLAHAIEASLKGELEGGPGAESAIAEPAIRGIVNQIRILPEMGDMVHGSYTLRAEARRLSDAIGDDERVDALVSRFADQNPGPESAALELLFHWAGARYRGPKPGLFGGAA